MKRATTVLAATAFGLAGAFGYQSTTTGSPLVGTSDTPAARPPSWAAYRPPGGPPPLSGAVRSATGADVDFGYGSLQVRVTMSGGRVTAIAVVRLAVSNPRSAANNRRVVPRLDRQAMLAQSARINGVSGASYTTLAYRQSLQSALDKLGTTVSAP